MNAKTKFKEAHSFARKNLSELCYRSADINGSVETEAFEYHLADMMFGKVNQPLPAVVWNSICAVTRILCQPDAQQSTPQERLQERRFWEEAYYPYN